MFKKLNAQKVIHFFSVIELIYGILFLVVAGLFIAGLSYVSSQDATIAQRVSKSFPDLVFPLVKSIINAILIFVQWRALKTLSKDASKHHHAWVITLFVIAFEIMNFITNLTVGVPRGFGTLVSSIIINLIILYFITQVNAQAQTNA
ncbi:MAG: hypothetical protein IKE51_00520 [Solobacterium sp.]|nr:hypothetical protein [Solobacterium sp.]